MIGRHRYVKPFLTALEDAVVCRSLSGVESTIVEKVAACIGLQW